MQFSRQIQLIEQLLELIPDTEQAIAEISDELLKMKKQEVLEIVKLASVKRLADVDYSEICWKAYLLGEMK